MIIILILPYSFLNFYLFALDHEWFVALLDRAFNFAFQTASMSMMIREAELVIPMLGLCSWLLMI